MVKHAEQKQTLVKFGMLTTQKVRCVHVYKSVIRSCIGCYEFVNPTNRLITVRKKR